MKKYIGMLVLGLVIFGAANLVWAQSDRELNTLENLVVQLQGAIASLSRLQGAAVTTSTNSGSGCAAGPVSAAGTKGQLIYCNGSKWVASTEAIYDGTRFGLKSLAGSGNGFLCVDTQGFFFRSQQACR